MTSALASVHAASRADRRMAAFCDRQCPEIFHCVATPTSIWQADPFDVESIDSEARDAFERLLHRGGQTPLPPSGAVLVLLGEAGSGKTHLMRAFRTRAHSQGLGYCGYLQMTTEASNYARYMLTNLIEALESPYSPSDPMSTTGLGRLSTGLLEYVPRLSSTEREALRLEEGDVTRMVDDFADRLHATQRFHNCDVELLRIMLHLRRSAPQVHSRALMWLRCQAMRPQDCEWIGNAVPRTDDADPIRMLQQLALLTDAVHCVPLILLVDQLEDMANQSAPVERFRKVVDAIAAFTDQISNAVVVLACLEDYFKENVKKLIQAKHDRLVRDPEPIRLRSYRTSDEIRAMVARRLAYLYDMADVEIDAEDELFPFRANHVERLKGMRSRDVLDFLRRHHERCIKAGQWKDPNEPTLFPRTQIENDLDALWNDFHSAFAGAVPDDEQDLAWALADAVRAASFELPEGFHFGCLPPDGRFLEVETHNSDHSVGKLLVAVCNKSAQGGGLGRQLLEVEKRMGDFPTVLVRTTDFPTSKGSNVVKQMAALLKRNARCIAVADADWRRMLAFEAFRKHYSGRADFAAWQKSARPLSELHSLQTILRLNLSSAPRPTTAAKQSPPHPLAPSDAQPPARESLQTAPPETLNPIVLGHTKGLQPSTVSCGPGDFTQHAAFLGRTGSGKTTAALNLIEQLLDRNIPAMLLDRKGDLCRYADPAAWQRPLGDPDRLSARHVLRQKLDIALFTPGEPAGRPLALPVVPPGFDELPQADRERYAQYAAAALGSMIGFKTSDKDKGQRAILAKAIETLTAAPGATISVPMLREVIQNQDDALLNAIGGGYPANYYETLAQRLLTLELNNRQLLSGAEQLNVDALLGTGSFAKVGRVRLSIISTRFLGDSATVDFWVSQLLVAVSRWCARSPQPQLQAVFLFDEADIYLPAIKQPATKAPMEDLLKRARSAGVGIFLATQSPGDFDYRCKENVRTWLIGRIKEPRAIEKLKPMLAAAKTNVADKLAGQTTGEFYLVRDTSVTPVHSNESLIRTEQLSESEIVSLARLIS
jgi:Helicase HerA, central domain